MFSLGIEDLFSCLARKRISYLFNQCKGHHLLCGLETTASSRCRLLCSSKKLIADYVIFVTTGSRSMGQNFFNFGQPTKLLKGTVFADVCYSVQGKVPIWPLPIHATPSLGYPTPYWHLVVIAGDLFKVVHFRTYQPICTDIWWWPLKRVVRILLEWCLVI